MLDFLRSLIDDEEKCYFKLLRFKFVDKKKVFLKGYFKGNCYTLSVQKLGMVLAKKISEFLIFRKGPVMEVLKIPNFLERLGQKFKFLMKISIFTYRFIEFISNPVYIFNCKWVALLWPSYHDAEVERINFWRHLMAKIENPFCLWPINLWVDYLNSGRR